MKHTLTITSGQIKRVLKVLKKYEVKPQKDNYEIWLPVDSKSARAIDEEVKKQLND
jgi:hypothetical protein